MKCTVHIRKFITSSCIIVRKTFFLLFIDYFLIMWYTIIKPKMWLKYLRSEHYEKSNRNNQKYKRRLLASLLCTAAIISAGSVSLAVPETTSIFSLQVSATQDRSSNFSKNYKLTGNNASDLVAVSQAQLGKTGAQLNYSEQWCADFVTDCARLANISAIPYNYASRGGCIYLYNYMVNNCGATVVSSPKKGDIVFFDWNGNKSASNLHHVAIVTSYSNNTVYLIGGNQGSEGTLSARKVTQTSYSINSKYIAKIVRPKYNNSTTPPVNTDTTYFPRYTGSSGSIVTGLNAVGADSSYAYRQKIAAANGISNYTGTAAQNTTMLNKLKSGTLKKPGTGSNSTPSSPSASYFPRYTGSSGSIVTGLNAVGADSSYAYRQKIAAVNGISNYTGTAAQNTTMLNKLKSGTLKKP